MEKGREKIRVWNDLKEYKPNLEDSLVLDEGDVRDKMDILKKINPGEYLVINTMDSGKTDTKSFQETIYQLREMGLDIGRGDSQYGFKMPIPNKKDTHRKLTIFRRKWTTNFYSQYLHWFS